MRSPAKAASTSTAIATIAGSYPPFDDCDDDRPIPLIAFHGTADRLLPYHGRGERVPAVQPWAARWAARNGCNDIPSRLPTAGDVTGLVWSGCGDDAAVVLYTINGKGHSWPGSNMPPAITTRHIDASAVLWAFFREHRRR